MVKGHYRKEYGGSKSGYQKGVKDTIKVTALGVLVIVVISIVYFLSTN